MVCPAVRRRKKNMVISESVEIGGRELTIEMGKLARQADGAVVITYGEPVVMVTAVRDRRPKGDASLAGINSLADGFWKSYLEDSGRPDTLFMTFRRD